MYEKKEKETDNASGRVALGVVASRQTHWP